MNRITDKVLEEEKLFIDLHTFFYAHSGHSAWYGLFFYFDFRIFTTFSHQLTDRKNIFMWPLDGEKEDPKPRQTATCFRKDLATLSRNIHVDLDFGIIKVRPKNAFRLTST